MHHFVVTTIKSQLCNSVIGVRAAVLFFLAAFVLILISATTCCYFLVICSKSDSNRTGLKAAAFFISPLIFSYFDRLSRDLEKSSE